MLSLACGELKIGDPFCLLIYAHRQEQKVETAMTGQSRAIIKREGDEYVALCSDLDIALRGATVVEARAKLKAALMMFFETTWASEIYCRPQDEMIDR